jgi:hypothetical protein
MDIYIQWQIYGMLAYLLSLEPDEYNQSLSLMMDGGACMSGTLFPFRQGFYAMQEFEELACGEWEEERIVYEFSYTGQVLSFFPLFHFYPEEDE